MKTACKTTVVNEFLRDQQRLVQLLQDVVALVDEGKIAAARALAEKLNRVAGPHIEFEENILYPATVAPFGADFGRKLLAGHSNAQAGLLQLLGASDARLSNPEFQRRVAIALRGGLKHAESRSTLVGHLERFSEAEQQKALAQLNGLKREGRRWTELKR